jgi:hypothetical protein
MAENNDNLLNEHLEKIKYRFNYAINETPKYKSIVEDEYDDIPTVKHATQDGQPMPNAGGGSDAYYEGGDNNDDQLPGAPQTAPTDPVAEPSNAPAPDNAPPPDNVPIDTNVDVDVSAEMPMEEPPVDLGPTVDELQNDVIKQNIEAMKEINDKLEGLDVNLQKINSEMDNLNYKVKEVEEPTNAEKLVARKDVSYPYYFNLNDVWKDNWFEQNRKDAGEKGINELPDGTYVADFDELPKPSEMDINDSFNDII